MCFCLSVTALHDLAEQTSLITDCCNSLTLWIPCCHRGVFRIINSTNVADYLRGAAPFTGRCWYRVKADSLNVVCSQTAGHRDFIWLLLHSRWGRIYISPGWDKSALQNRVYAVMLLELQIHTCSVSFPSPLWKTLTWWHTFNPFKIKKTSLAVFYSYTAAPGI